MSLSISNEIVRPSFELATLSKYAQCHFNAAALAASKAAVRLGIDVHSTRGVYGSDASSEYSHSTHQHNVPSPDNAPRHTMPAQHLSSDSEALLDDESTEDVTCGKLSEFTLLAELPNELQDQIWQMSMQPRIVELRAREVSQCLYAAQRPIPMWNVSKKKRNEAVSAHGYMKLQIPARKEGVYSCTFIINPTIDILYISIWTDCSLNSDKILSSLVANNLLDKIRSVALDYTETRNEDGSMNDWIRDLNLRSFPSLELVLIILCAQNQDWPSESGMLSRFEAFTDEESCKDCFPWVADDIVAFKKELQRKWARGPEGIVPYIVFVEESYKRPVYWKMEDRALAFPEHT